uniref:Minor capsid protein from bacteriophage n=1 Tax=Siphoviridae sp. ctnFo11 TaxID=2826454 RepID=A0A8S5N5F4_9CAUD|nr:MAG TPA: Minor capsid protein from bacteriophage [Siphoviridae sp. ctnFo11]
MEEVEHLTVGDAENAASAVLALVLQYPVFPKTFKANNKTVRWNTTCDDSTSIGIFPLQGARYIKKYVSGNYTAQFPYQIIFRSSPTTNKTSIDAQTVLDKLAEWMEGAGVEFKDVHMQLEAISRTSVVCPVYQDTKQVGYGVNMQLKYFYKK